MLDELRGAKVLEQPKEEHFISVKTLSDLP